MEGTYDERKLAILKSAARVISKQGFRKFTFRQIASEADISPGTLYYYYNSKNLILYDILDYTQSYNEILVKAMKEGEVTPEEVRNRLMRNYDEHARDTNGNKIFLHLMHESLSGDDELAERLRDKYNAWLGSFEKVIELHFGIPQGPINKTVAILLNAVIDGLSNMELMGIEAVNLPSVKNFFEKLINGEFDAIAGVLKENQTFQSEYSKDQIHKSDAE